MKSAARSYRRNIGIIVLLSLIFAAAMGYYTYHYEPDMYLSTVGLYLLPSGTSAETQDNPQSSRMLAMDAAQMLRNPEVTHKTNEKLWPDDIDNTKITLEEVKGTHMVRLKAYGADPALCQRAAIAASVVLTEQMQSIANVETISVAERAELPEEPAGPQRVLKILATFGGVFAMLSILWLLLAPKKKRITALDAERGDWGTTVLGSVADYRKDIAFFFKNIKNKPEILAQYVNRSTVEDVKALSIALRKEMGNEIRSIVFASHQADEGKSTLAALLATELCLQGKRVLLVDMDCYSPTQGRLFRVAGAGGLVEYLSGEVDLDDIVLPTDIPNLFVVDNLRSQAMAGRMSEDSALSFFLEQMSAEFDLIFFDAPPVSLFADAAALGSVMDATLLVVAQERLTEEELRDTLQKLKKTGKRLCGMVFNFVKPRRVKQYSNYEDATKARKA